MLTYNTLVVLVGAALLGLLCGVVGSFAVLRRRSLLGDAIAHAALPGIAVAFLVLGVRSLPVLLTGALAAGLFGVAALAWMRRRTRTKEDAALALVLSVMFGAGVSLSRWVSNHVPDGSQAGLDTFILGKTAGIVLADVALVGAVALGCTAVVAALFKELRLAAFDPGYAEATGWPSARLDFLIMAMVALAVVVGLPMVGVVMVAALTILPGATARLWTDRLAVMLWLAAGFGVLGTTVGVAVSASFARMPTGPIVVLAAAAVFLVSALVAPQRGVVSTALARRRRADEVGALLLLRARRAGADPVRFGVPAPARSSRVARTAGWLDTSGEPTAAGLARISEAGP